jgi:hypothetical protein
MELHAAPGHHKELMFSFPLKDFIELPHPNIEESEWLDLVA